MTMWLLVVLASMKVVRTTAMAAMRRPKPERGRRRIRERTRLLHRRDLEEVEEADEGGMTARVKVDVQMEECLAHRSRRWCETSLMAFCSL
jgi:hypothetical protein